MADEAARASRLGQLREKERGTSGIVIRGTIKTRFRCSGDRPDTHLRPVVSAERRKINEYFCRRKRNLLTVQIIGLAA